MPELQPWCDAAFGPTFINPDGDPEPTFACRLRVEHDGAHECPASVGQGWVEPELRPPASMTRVELEEWLDA